MPDVNIGKVLPIIGIILFLYLVVVIGPSKIFESLLSMKLEYLLPVGAMFVVCVVVQVLKWNVILKKFDMKLPFWDALIIYMAGLFYGVITPARIGSIIRSFYLSKKFKKPLSECISNVIVERFIDISIVSFLSMLGYILFFNVASNFSLWLGVVVILLSTLGFIFSDTRKSRKILSVIHAYVIPEKFKENASVSFKAFYKNFPAPFDLTLPVALGFIAWILVYTQPYVIAVGLDIEIPYIYFITLFPIATLVSLIPITVGGIGTREAALIFLFSSLDVLPAKIVSLSIILYVFELIFVMILGGISIKLIESSRR